MNFIYWGFTLLNLLGMKPRSYDCWFIPNLYHPKFICGWNRFWWLSPHCASNGMSSNLWTRHTAPEAEVSLILVANHNLSWGWAFRANATKKWIFQKDLQREPILVLIYTKNLFSTFSVIFSQNLKSIIGFKPVT